VAKKKDKGEKSKTVAGVKVPKALRKGLVASFVDDPRTREILADVLMAAAGAAAAALIKHRPSAQQVAEAGASAAGATRDVAQSAVEAVTETVADAARHILPASLTGAGEREGADVEGKRPDQDSYAHLSERDSKGKKDKHRSKASKH
jgi:hypothetical protein